MWAEFFALRLWRCSGQLCSNQQSYGQMDVMVGFSRSERPRNNFGRSSDCSGRLFYGREKWIGLNQITLHMAPAFQVLHISRKLLSSLLAEQHGVYCHSLPRLCVRIQEVWGLRCLWWFKLQSGLRISLQSIDAELCLPVNDFMGQEGKCQLA